MSGLDIQGWMAEDELDFLGEFVKAAGPEATIVELGAWKGRSTARLYESMLEGQTIVTVDTWLGQPDLRFTAHSDAIRGDIFLEFMSNMRAEGFEPIWYNNGAKGACYLRMDSCDAAELFHEVNRLIIDCDHNMVGKDIDRWLPIMAPDGSICGHDYNWEGVKEQVLERIPITYVVADIWVSDFAAESAKGAK